MASKQKSSAQAANGEARRALTEYQRELAQYLEERIKPGLNAGAIPPLARSIARDIAAQEPPEAPDDGEATMIARRLRRVKPRTLWPTCTTSRPSSAQTGSCVSQPTGVTAG